MSFAGVAMLSSAGLWGGASWMVYRDGRPGDAAVMLALAAMFVLLLAIGAAMDEDRRAWRKQDDGASDTNTREDR